MSFGHSSPDPSTSSHIPLLRLVSHASPSSITTTNRDPSIATMPSPTTTRPLHDRPQPEPTQLISSPVAHPHPIHINPRPFPWSRLQSILYLSSFYIFIILIAALLVASAWGLGEQAWHSGGHRRWDIVILVAAYIALVRGDLLPLSPERLTPQVEIRFGISIELIRTILGDHQYYPCLVPNPLGQEDPEDDTETIHADQTDRRAKSTASSSA